MMWKSILFILVAGIVLIIIRYVTLPDIIKTDLQTKIVASRNYYTSVSYDGAPVDTSAIAAVKIYFGFFNFDTNLDHQETKTLLKVLFDSKNYTEAESNINLSEPHMTLIYYNKSGSFLGGTYISDGGDTFTFPSILVSKNGHLSDEGLNVIKNQIK